MTSRQRIALLACLLAVLLACSDDADPDDPTVQHVMENNGLVFYNVLDGFGLFNTINSPPRLTEALTDNAGQIYSVRGMWPMNDRLLEETDLAIQVYEMVPNGCGRPMKRGRLLGQTNQIGSDGQWSIDGIQVPEDVNFFSSVLVKEDDPYSQFGNLLFFPSYTFTAYSPLGELRIKNSNGHLLTVEPEGQTAMVRGSAQISGRGIPGACYNLWRAGQRLEEFEVGAGGEWSVPLAINAGENPLEFRLSNPGVSQTTAITIIGTVEEKLIWPLGSFDENDQYVSDPTKGTVTAWAGRNDAHRLLISSPHSGIDISAKSSPDIHAVADGVIFNTYWDFPGGGNVVLIDHGAWATIYLHLSEFSDLVKTGKGKSIKAGTVIGKMGKTGGNYGVHLHLTAFRWPDIHHKNPNYYLPSKASLLNLNPRKSDPTNLDACYSPVDYWDLDWSQVKEAGNRFEFCLDPANKTDCGCLE